MKELTKKARGGPPALLTISQAAEFLSIHPNTLRSWIKKGMVHSYQLGTRGDRRFSVQDLQAVLEGFRLHHAAKRFDDQQGP